MKQFWLAGEAPSFWRRRLWSAALLSTMLCGTFLGGGVAEAQPSASGSAVPAPAAQATPGSPARGSPAESRVTPTATATVPPEPLDRAARRQQAKSQRLREQEFSDRQGPRNPFQASALPPDV